MQSFWEKFCQKEHLEKVTYKDAFQFGAEADWLADLVVKDKKTATTSAHVFYELEKEPLPEVGQYFIVLNSKDEPQAVIQIEEVEILPMNQVTENFALAEGAGDYTYWWNAHEKFLTNILKIYNLEFSPDMLVVCERFKTVFTV